MGLPRFKPARVCDSPRDFGRIQWPLWADPNPLDEVQTAWALFQHQASYAVSCELAAACETIDDLARDLGEDSAWLTRKLHGQTPVDLGDVMSWALHYGIHILPVINESKELRTK